MVSYSVYLMCCFIFLFICKKEYYNTLFTQMFIYLLLTSITYSATLFYFTDIMLLLNLYLIIDTILITYLFTKVYNTTINNILIFIAVLMFIVNFITIWSNNFIAIYLSSDLYLYETLLLLNYSFLEDTKLAKYSFYFINAGLMLPHLLLMIR